MSLVEIKDVPGRGVGVVAAKPIASGHIVMSELPLLVYPQNSAIPYICSHCLRFIDIQGGHPFTPCPTCPSSRFCSQKCSKAALEDPGSHCTLVCQATQACNISGHTDDHLSQLHYLIRATSLILAAHSGNPLAGARASQLSSLSSRGPLPINTTTQQSLSSWHHETLGRLTHAFRVIGADISSILDIGTVSALLERDLVNGYGISLPILHVNKQGNHTDSEPISSSGGDFDADSSEIDMLDGNSGDVRDEISKEVSPTIQNGTQQQQHTLRGTALYSQLSRINHECLPNVARLDNFDAPSQPDDGPPGSNMLMQFRAMHALPAGEEITQSYFPLPWTFVERQGRLVDQFGFQCICPRCIEESSWERNEQEESVYQTLCSNQSPQFKNRFCRQKEEAEKNEDQSSADPAYIHLFLLKYVCPFDGCGGTMSPLGVQREELQCNVCGAVRTEGEFLEEVEKDAMARHVE